MHVIEKRIAELRYERQLVMRALRALKRLSDMKTENTASNRRPRRPVAPPVESSTSIGTSAHQ